MFFVRTWHYKLGPYPQPMHTCEIHFHIHVINSHFCSCTRLTIQAVVRAYAARERVNKLLGEVIPCTYIAYIHIQIAHANIHTLHAFIQTSPCTRILWGKLFEAFSLAMRKIRLCGCLELLHFDWLPESLTTNHAYCSLVPTKYKMEPYTHAPGYLCSCISKHLCSVNAPVGP